MKSPERLQPSLPLIHIIKELAESGRLGGLLLMGATVLSMALANSPWAEPYTQFWHAYLGAPPLKLSVEHWVNDGLMVVFFFLVGLEIKREVLLGELSSVQQSLLPAVAAVGGMIVPAGIFLFFNAGTPAVSAWAVPTATDIAFSLAVLSLLGPRVPFALSVFLTALAIIDDLLAILVIAVFYTEQLHGAYLAGAAGLLAALIVLNRLRVKNLFWYFALGLGLWFCVLQSGVHATLAGVLLALTIPLNRVEDLEHHLHGPVNYGIVPVFALANTAIGLSATALGGLIEPLGLGILLGLVVGKPLGIAVFVWISNRLGLTSLPQGVTKPQLIGAGCAAGIGFTMSIFIANLSFTDIEALNVAKLAVVGASLTAGIVAFGWLRASTDKEV